MLAFLAGAFTNVFTQGWSLPVGAGLGVLVVGWVGWEMRQAGWAAGERGPDPEPRATPPQPAPSGGAVVPRQLPAPVRHFAGRNTELAALTGQLGHSRTGRGETMVISAIGGTAGIGKTALAVYWAHQAAADFPDGQLYVNLRGFEPAGAPMTTPAEALRGFLDAFEVPPHRIPAGLDAQAALYRSLLAGKRALVVLDNARDADQVRPLLPGAVGCLVLVTSRNRLSGLVTVEGAHPLTLDLLTLDEARELLARRLGAERLAAEPEAVAEIIRHCARLPVALAVVAARAATNPTFTLTELAGQLRENRGRLDALTDDDTSDVRSVFSWSYRSLTPETARLFRLLGLHPGPDVTGPAAASLAGLPLSRARPLLADLVRANLLVEHVPRRYTFHDLLRAYANEQAHAVDSADERHAATQRALDHYLHTAYAATHLIDRYRDPITLPAPHPGVTPESSADHRQAAAWFTAEHQVLLATVDVAATTGSETQAWQLAWTLDNFLWSRGHWPQLAAVGRTALDAARRLADRPAQARAHQNLVNAYTRLGLYDEAQRHAQQALTLHRQGDNPAGQAHTHMFLVKLRARQGRHAEALDHGRQALDLYAQVGEEIWRADALNAVGGQYGKLGEPERALDFCRQALAIYQRHDDRRGQVWTWEHLGFAHYRLGDHPTAVACYQRALELCQGLDYPDSEAGLLAQLGDTQQAAGDLDAARDSWRRALAIIAPDHVDADGIRGKLRALPVPAGGVDDATSR
ncbi:ATP-binding protein [Plantactinospora soyae]|uniref:Tetratricopeptide (TPR) repeat protein n=1 Tax=Plantactinospora soyae TaxID=1544732 RepID=A0A927MBJ0_9ACTN|nr:tetratricopeptide repeat protein [Plantactinospora soyae]MBE1491542.1 tetratricopeptide (TPR) repeat protein [Plantactinospora soyae]